MQIWIRRVLATTCVACRYAMPNNGHIDQHFDVRVYPFAIGDS
jgi:hypothetical protein